MPIDLKIKIDDKSFLKDIDKLDFFNDSSVKFGLLEKEGKKLKETPDGTTNIKLIDVAVEHEFHIPNGTGRSFVRSSFDNNKDNYLKDLSNIASDSLVSKSKDNLNNRMKQLGDKALNDIKSTIDKGIPPPLSKWSIIRKTESKGISIRTPLIWTGQLRNSLSNKVDTK